MADGVQTERTLDPFLLEIISDALMAIGDEMFITTQQTSQSVVVYEVLDFAVGLTDARGDLIAQGTGVTLFLGFLSPAVKSVIATFGPERITEDDIFMTNDPYGGGGTHLNDVTVVSPIFVEGTLVAFAANKAHWIEVGGRDPGSVSTETTSIYQEGLQLPCVKVFERGVPNEGLFDLIEANVRTPAMSLGDLHAQTASVRLAARRFKELCEKYGVTLIQAALERMMGRSEELARLQLAKLPAGAYEAEDWIESGGTGNAPYRVCVKVTISPDAFVCDFTGSHPQVLSSINSSRASLNSVARILFKAITDPAAAVNEGSFRPVEVICPSGTVFTSERPAPVSTYWQSVMYVADLIWKALAPAVPDRLTAGHYLSPCSDLIAGTHPETGELFILFEPNAGGWGAGLGKDGERGLICIGDGETYIIPVEVAEQRYGLIVEQYAFNVTGSGAGKWRGGEGISRDYRLTAETATVNVTFGRYKFPPWGVAGGFEGSPNEICFIDQDGLPRLVTGMISLKQGDVVRIRTATGGGWGNPLERDPQLVAADVRNEFVSCEQSEAVYGVIIDPKTFEVVDLTDARKTAQI